MNQLDETVTAPTSPMSNSTVPTTTPNQASEIPATEISAAAQVPTAPMPNTSTLPNIQASTPSDTPVVASQPIDGSQPPSQPAIFPTSISSLPVTKDLPSTDSTPDSIKTIPLPAQETSAGLPKVETEADEIAQVSALSSMPTINSPISNSVSEVSQVSAPTMTTVSDSAGAPTSQTPSSEPQQVLATSPNLPLEPVTPIGMSSNSLPSLDEKPSVQQPMEPIEIAAKPMVNPEPLPAPLTPPTIKTSPSPVMNNPSSSQATTPINVTMNSAQAEPLNKPAGQVSPVLVKGAGKYQIRVINEKCIGAASCVAVAPKAFKLNEQQIAEVLASASEESDENLLLSAQSCPTMAIEIIDSETGKKVWPR